MASTTDYNCFTSTVGVAECMSAFYYKSILMSRVLSYLFAGVRQEQDIYIRLVDSVTKQVRALFIVLIQTVTNVGT